MGIKILRKVDGSLISVIDLDATISHEIALQTDVTEHPVEGGGTVVDNARNNPDQLTVTGLVSNTPFARPGATRPARQLTGLIPGIGLAETEDKGRRRTAYQALRGIRANKELVQIQDELDVYDNMLMINLTIPRDRTTYNAFQFTAVFKKVEKVGVQVITIAADSQSQAIASKAADAGKKTPTESTDQETERASLLFQLKEGAAGSAAGVQDWIGNNWPF